MTILESECGFQRPGLKTGLKETSYGLKQGQDLKNQQHTPTKNSQENPPRTRLFCHKSNFFYLRQGAQDITVMSPELQSCYIFGIGLIFVYDEVGVVIYVGLNTRFNTTKG